MEELSESYKRLQNRHQSEVEASKKARENMLRALLGIIGLGSITDACMSKVDAKRDQIIEDSIKLLEDNIGALKVKELEIIAETETIRIEMISIVKDVNKLKSVFNQLLDSKDYYQSSELKQLIITNIEINQKTFNNTTEIKAEVTEVKTLLQNFIEKQDRIGIDKELNQRRNLSVDTVEPITDEEVIIKMGEQIITRVNELIDKNELESALSILDGLINSTDFNKLNEDLRIGILVTKGSVFIKLLDVDKAKEIFNELGKVKTNNRHKWNYIFKFGTITSDEQIVNKALDELNKLGLSDDEIKIKQSSYFLAIGKTDDIISLLEEDGGEGND